MSGGDIYLEKKMQICLSAYFTLMPYNTGIQTPSSSLIYHSLHVSKQVRLARMPQQGPHVNAIPLLIYGRKPI